MELLSTEAVARENEAFFHGLKFNRSMELVPFLPYLLVRYIMYPYGTEWYIFLSQFVLNRYIRTYLI